MSTITNQSTQLAGLPLVHHKSGRDLLAWYYQLDGSIDGYDKLRVSLYYSKGGTNWTNGKVEPRGYYVSLQPVSLTKSDWGVSESCTLFSDHGGKVFLEETGRFSAAKILTLQPQALEAIEPYMAELVVQAV